MNGLMVSLRKVIRKGLVDMLYRLVLLPSIFTSILDNQPATYTLVIDFLRRLEETGVVIVEDLYSMQKILDNWPQRFKDKARSILTQLFNHNRIITISLSDQSQLASISAKQCTSHLRIIQSYPVEFVVARQECKECFVDPISCLEEMEAQIINSSTDIINIDEFSLNEKLCRNLERRDRFYAPGVGQQQFEREVLIPLFRDAARIEIYDRYIGRSILSKNSRQYQKALKWILGIFKRESRLRQSGTVEIYTGIFTRSHKNQPLFNRTDAINEFKKLEVSMRTLLPRFRIFVKEEDHSKQMLHDRFLFTDQIGISIGRGFNLILSRGRLYDTHIGYCTEKKKIRNAFNNLSTPLLYQSPNP